MKPLFTLLTSLFVTLTFAQQKLIAVKGNVTDAITTTLTDAIALAQPGDKIYLPGGFFSHTTPIDKPVHIIGTGFQDGMNVMGRTTINGSLTLGDLADNSTFEGLYLTEWFTQTENSIADNISIKRCNMKGTNLVYTSNYINSNFINCVVRITLHLGYHDGTSASAAGENNYIKNCIVGNYVQYTNSSEIENCLLLGVIYCSNSFVKKNVFYRNDTGCDAITSSTGIVLADNLFRLNCYPAYNFGSTISTESGTIIYPDISDVFVNVPSTTFFDFNPTYDYHLKAPYTTTSPSAGIYSGSFPWKDGSLPIIPNIEQNNSYLDVQNETFKLNVKVVPQTH